MWPVKVIKSTSFSPSKDFLQSLSLAQVKERAMKALWFFHNGTNINRLTFAFPDLTHAPPASTYDIEPTTEL